VTKVLALQGDQKRRRPGESDQAILQGDAEKRAKEAYLPKIKLKLAPHFPEPMAHIFGPTKLSTPIHQRRHELSTGEKQYCYLSNNRLALDIYFKNLTKKNYTNCRGVG
jgi:hypothetical protein